MADDGGLELMWEKWSDREAGLGVRVWSGPCDMHAEEECPHATWRVEVEMVGGHRALAVLEEGSAGLGGVTALATAVVALREAVEAVARETGFEVYDSVRPSMN